MHSGKKPTLKPCPFCGTPDTGEYPFRSTRGNESVSYVAGCPNPNCGVEIWEDTLEKSVAAWNRRHPEPSQTTTANKVTMTAPERIWLNVSDDHSDCREPFPAVPHEGLTWCADSVVACEVEYVRADLAAAAG